MYILFFHVHVAGKDQLTSAKFAVSVEEWYTLEISADVRNTVDNNYLGGDIIILILSGK